MIIISDRMKLLFSLSSRITPSFRWRTCTEEIMSFELNAIRHAVKYQQSGYNEYNKIVLITYMIYIMPPDRLLLNE
jgi:hypothetical protein